VAYETISTKFCGATNPEPITTSSTSLTITFHSDVIVAAHGVEIGIKTLQGKIFTIINFVSLKYLYLVANIVFKTNRTILFYILLYILVQH